MRPEWRLATNSLSRRGSRTALLIAAVALSGALIVAVACAMASINGAIRSRLTSAVGRADLTIRPVGGTGDLDRALLEELRAWPEAAEVSGVLRADMPLWGTQMRWVEVPGGGFGQDGSRPRVVAVGHGLGPARLAEIDLLDGRTPVSAREIVVDATLLEVLNDPEHARRPRLGFGWGEPGDEIIGAEEAARRNEAAEIGLGSTVLMQRLMRREELTIVGVAAPPPLGGRAQAYTTLDGMQALTGSAGRYSAIEIVLVPGADAADVVQRRSAELGAHRMLQTSAKVSSGLDKNLRSSELGLVLAAVLSFMSAAVIIMTGLTTNVAERQRELAILRCIGSTRGTLAWSQLLVGAMIGGAGAAVGLPLGVALAWALVAAMREQLPDGLVVSGMSVWLAVIGSIGAGIAGAAWPAWRASRTSPLRAMQSHAVAARPRGLRLTLLFGLVALLVQLLIVGVPDDGQVVFWGYATVGLPVMFAGYFLLSVPATILVVRALGGAITRVLRLPRHLLDRTVLATPYRHGFTAGAMMGGLALMVAIWTNGGAIMRDWISLIQFPDAFVSGLAIGPEARERLDRLPFIERTCAVTLQPVEIDTFGVRAIQRFGTTFVGFEPEAFFAMAELEWIEGDPVQAQRRLAEGGAVLVAREFRVAQGLGVGETFECERNGERFSFEIVGVITSPGLEIVSRFFNVGEELADQVVHAVFGSRADVVERFGNDSIHLIQIDLTEGTDEVRAVERIRDELFDAGILDAGTGGQIKGEILLFVRGTLLVFSVIAVTAMLVACFGVANLIVAGIDARRYEFGVLRSVGASHGLLVRLVVGEAVIIAVAAGVTGTLMGIQGSWAGQRLYELLQGILLNLRPPPIPIAIGWGIVLVMTLGAAWPAIWRLRKLRPLDLLSAGRG